MLGATRAMLAALAQFPAGLDDAERVDLIGALEALKGAAAAAQATLTVDLYDSQRAVDQAHGVDQRATARSVGGQVALTRRESPFHGARHLALAQALAAEMPHTLRALQAGQISEWRSIVVTRETACASPGVRRAVDEELAARLALMSDRQCAAAASAATARLDPAGVAARRSAAVASRRVCLRPAPDAMSILTAILPMTDGIAAYLSLARAADTELTVAVAERRIVDGDRVGPGAGLTGAGRSGRGVDRRARGQVMADLFIERLTGRAVATGADVQISLAMSADSLLAGADEPAVVSGYGPHSCGPRPSHRGAPECLRLRARRGTHNHPSAVHQPRRAGTGSDGERHANSWRAAARADLHAGPDMPNSLL